MTTWSNRYGAALRWSRMRVLRRVVRSCQGGGARAWGSPSRPDPRLVPPAPRTPADPAGGTTHRRHARGLDGLEQVFDDGWVRRQDLGYRRLYSRCWEARLRGDVVELLQLAADPALTPDMLATIAPGAADRGATVELVQLVLAHPACSVGVASRYATHADPMIRMLVACFPGLLTSALAILAIDSNDEVRAAAVAVLDERTSTMTGD